MTTRSSSPPNRSSQPDKDTNFDLYDARVCTPASPCITYHEQTAQECESTTQCRPATRPPGRDRDRPAPPPTPDRATPRRMPAQGTKAVKQASKPKPLTRAQKLTKALESCRSRITSTPNANAAVVNGAARKAYGPKPRRQPSTRRPGAGRGAGEHSSRWCLAAAHGATGARTMDDARADVQARAAAGHCAAFVPVFCWLAPAVEACGVRRRGHRAAFAVVGAVGRLGAELSASGGQ